MFTTISEVSLFTCPSAYPERYRAVSSVCQGSGEPGEWGVSATELPTTFTYTGQREAAEIGLMYYVARWYDNEIGHFIQADSIVPGIENSLAWNRFAYVKYNPLTYVDPSGHADIISDTICHNGQCADSGQGTVEYYQSLMKDVFNYVFLDNWTLQEMKQIFVIGWRGASLMGGPSNYKESFANWTWYFYHYESDGGDLGKTSYSGTIGLKDDFSNWTLAHELGHALDFSNHEKYSRNMKKFLGAGETNWLNSFQRALGKEDEQYWYDPSSSPPVNGVDSNFNAKEDFAESFAAAVLPEEAYNNNVENFYGDPNYYWADWGSFYNTPRGRYMLSVLCP